ncbi:MAG: hypothetical protein Fur0032_18330 [Terrimicrobiaceae bacterium]
MVPETLNGLENPAVLDAMAHDGREDKVILAMYEHREWDGGEAQLFQLQEKLNAYLSFLLDGEFDESFPQLVGKKVEIQLRTSYEPDEAAWDLIRRIREQLAFQSIAFEVIDVGESGGCGHGCGCSHG